MGMALILISFIAGFGVGSSYFVLQLKRLKKSEQRALELRKQERTGRIRAEQEVQKLANSATAEESSSSNTWSLEHVGIFRSPFRERNGTPWQGNSAAVGIVEIGKRWSPSLSLDGLEDFSHIIIIFLFDKNVKGRKSQSAFRAKVKPPRTQNVSKGCLATRSPHRPCPVGLTVAKITSVDFSRGRIRVSNIDLLDGTHILDIKPYIPSYDSVAEARMPSWIEPEKVDFDKVEINPNVADIIAGRRTVLYESGTIVLDALKDLLRHDLRKASQKTDQNKSCHSVVFDGLRYKYEISKRNVHVYAVEKDSVK